MKDYKKIFDVEGKVAVIVGGSGGIGREIVSALAQYGAKVIILSKSSKKLKYFYDELIEAELDIHFYECDVRNEIEIIEVFSAIEKQFNTIDILINAAAINILNTVVESSISDWDEIMNVNLRGTFLCAREAAKIMKRNKRGKIINFASLAAVSGHKEHGAYAASKGGVVAFTKVLANELAEFGVNVNAIAPACIVTDVNKSFFENDEKYQEFTAEIPLRRLGKPEDIVGGVLYLASTASDFVSGTLLMIDGASSAV